MATFAVVEDLQVLEEIRAGLGTRCPGALRYELDLQCREETFRHRVVPAVAAAAHAAHDPVCSEVSLIVRARVLTSTIGVVEQAPPGLAACERRRERVQGELASDPRACCPAD